MPLTRFGMQPSSKSECSSLTTLYPDSSVLGKTFIFPFLPPKSNHNLNTLPAYLCSQLWNLDKIKNYDGNMARI